ncbi:von Willebrand factor type A domain-containing protein [Mycena capillaripes]|nr:von Willebrand factor type A domain-containing protein [Mycena capillaripes]
MVEQQTPDVFQLVVGNIQPHETVQVELIYATELAEDEENDSARFHLPVHVGARFGQAPTPYALQHEYQSLNFTSPFPTQSPFMEIFVNVETLAPIAKICCSSHTVSTELGPDPALPNAEDLSFSNYARVYLSSEALDRDFVLTVKSAGLDAPRCVAELHPIHPTTAFAFTLVPRFQLPDVSKQEFVFLIDCSGSMMGPRIETAKRALIVMLRALPTKDSLIQIASFGSWCTTLWQDGSRAYNQATLDYATEHVDSISANYGGTEIRAALKTCFEERKTDRPTSVFVLTDGDAWDLDGVFSEVEGAVARAPASGYLRVSVLGIGNSASTAMCEGIARVGNGICMMVEEQETSFTGKIARMLKAARTPLITDIKLDWCAPSTERLTPVDEDDAFVVVSDGEEEGDCAVKERGKEKEKAALNIFDETVDPLHLDLEPILPSPEVVLSMPPQVQQSPFAIRTLSPGNRLNVYAILQGRTVPKTVTLTGLTEDGSELRLSVPITLSNLPNSPDSPPAIHALAARKIIQDLEDGRHDIAASIFYDPDLLARTVKASIVRLAKTYSISSSQTSFLVVDESRRQRSNDLVPFISASIARDRVKPMSPSAPVYHDYVYRRRPNNTRRRQTLEDSMNPLTAPLVLPPIPVQHVDDAASKETQYLRRRCFNCQKTDTASWRRSTLNPGKIVCNMCGLYERTHTRARPLRFDELSREGVSVDPPTSPSTAAGPVAHTDEATLCQIQQTQYRQCFTCGRTDAPSWRRSSVHPGEIVCNKCGLFERSHARPDEQGLRCHR